MDNQTQAAQPAAALLRRPSHSQLQLQERRERHEAAKGRQERTSAAHTPHKPVLETEEFRVVEPDGTEDPWASADDGVVPDRPADDDRRRKDS